MLDFWVCETINGTRSRNGKKSVRYIKYWEGEIYCAYNMKGAQALRHILFEFVSLWHTSRNRVGGGAKNE